ncbi:MAG: bifunctional [glutamate--ammonia ligase]-adenylyl-L-tyrosine phosphorylase/[glutamate--ammonia-ligase] adenylyltransferase [Nitrospirae bacterium]|nr:bifunctional [glutamate--ammonia ligase]-adenylyl-L-tyrosine phosphorylase/[glutamate--ammonia-ligase] adenylyltransferase [Nitrospirota bacterium]
MPFKPLIEISTAARDTSDPKRAERNLARFFEENHKGGLAHEHLEITARLFASSQFLANFCIANPEELYSAIDESNNEVTKELLQLRAVRELVFSEGADTNDVIKALRIFKKRYLLRITLRDLSGKAGIQAIMHELSRLAEVVISEALSFSLRSNQSRFGAPSESAVTLIALGKLGGEELNYSSDVDLIAVYANDEGETSGVANPSGVIFNRISNHEFYCKAVELFSKLLSAQTEDGVAYRVDLRLRPQGQKGDIALPVKAYQTYYESWGRTWERMALIRARPVAGDTKLGAAFMKTANSFVWRETLDFTEIEEIKGLKKSIDSAFSRDDIKRGYGGIREAEFFVETFQLLFAAKNSSLKTCRILDAIKALKDMKMIPEEDLTILWENYLYLRRVEHYLQMKEDLQTHTLPSSDEEIEALAKNMGFPSGEDFLAGLRVRRMQVKSMYNGLLGTTEDVHTEALNLLEGELKDHELRSYLSFRKVRKPDQSLMNLNKIREHMRVFRTMQERSLSRKVMPQLLESALTAEDPDSAIAGIESLLTSFGIKTAHLTALMEQKELMEGIIKIFSLSSYLSRIFLSSPYYFNMLIEDWFIYKTLKSIEEKLQKTTSENEDFNFQAARFRRLEEVRLGMLFLQKILDTETLFRDMSYLAEAVINVITDKYIQSGLSVVALGKLGGREMTFGSDLDIIFIAETSEAASAAEKIMKSLTSYTDAGLLYSVDTRLRPDGSKGSLVKNIKGYKDYYLEKAHPWELQALLRARPVAGDAEIGDEFLSMASYVIKKRGIDVKKQEIAGMRKRIVKELSRESDGIDIKLGPGGIEEIEFHVQYLQLHNAEKYPEVLVQNTPAAIKRLAKSGIISETEKTILLDAYEYLRKIETLMKLNSINIINSDPDFIVPAALFMKHKNSDEFLARLRSVREGVTKVIFDVIEYKP